MYKSSFSACLLVIALMSPWAVLAAGLGNLTLNSALGQPLKAEIDLVSVKPDEIDSLKAGLASREAFEQAGINYEPFFSTFKISIEPRVNGKPYVKINSTQSINEPFLNILMELSWSSGRLLREYTVLLDPIEAKLPEPVAPKTRPAPTAAIVHNPSLNTVSQSEIQTDHSSMAAESVGDKPLRDMSDTYGPVNRGDTLTGIVRQIFPQDANLNQILVALYRANRDAFIADNMNLLKVGKILRIPSSSEISEISVREANKEVKIQIADWQSYRDKLASAVHEPQTEEKLTQSDSGEILTTVENEKTGIEESPKEVLRVSSGADSIDLENAADDGTLDRLHMMEEDSIARNLALKEANERVAMLEKNIENLQRLLELKDPDLAKAQIQAENTPDDSGAMPETESIAVITTPSEPATEEPMLDSMLEQNASSDPVIENTSEESVMHPIQLPETEEVSLMDQLMGNIQYVGGTLAIMLLGILSLVIRRRKKNESDADIVEMDFDDTPSALRHKMASAAAAVNSVSTFNAATAKDQNDEIDNASEYSTDEPLLNKKTMGKDESDGETDFFSNENIHQDTKINEEVPDTIDELQHKSNDSIANPSENKNKIDLNMDETVAETVNDSKFTKSNESENWSSTPVDSNNEIEFDFDDAVDDNARDAVHENDDVPDAIESTSNISMSQTNSSEITFEDTADSFDETLLPASAAEEKNTADEIDDEFIIDLNDAADHIQSDESFTHLEQKSAQEIASSLEFQADTREDTNTTVKSDEEAMANDVSSLQEDEEQRSDKPEELELALDFPEESTINEDSSASDSTKFHTETVFTDNNLDLEESPVISSPGKNGMKDAVNENDITDTVKKSAQWHEVSTKIDLARAYLEMDDKEGALEILDEVLREGDSQQQRTARDMLADLEQK